MSSLFVTSKGQTIPVCQRRKKCFHMVNSEEMLCPYCFNYCYKVFLCSVAAIKLAFLIHL